MQQPPPIVEKFQYYTLKQINLEGKRVYQTPSGEKVPSVTTILSKTKDMTAINEWKQRVGETEAKRIVTEASGVGSAMHANLERYLAGEQRVPGSNLVHLQANKMADQIISQALVHVNEVWGIEQSLYFPGLYSGTADLVGVTRGEVSFVAFNLKHKSGILHDPFSDCFTGNQQFHTLLENPPTKISGEIWPEHYFPDEEE